MDWLSHTFTLSVAISFVAGTAGGSIVNWFLCRRKVKEGNTVRRSTSFQVVVGVAIVVAMLFIMITTQRAHDCAVKLSATITVEQAIAAQERKALQDLFLAAMSPPPDIAVLPPTDPARVAWGNSIGKAYINTLSKTAQERDANEANRGAAKQACGR